jgi:hypothetical protein
MNFNVWLPPVIIITIVVSYILLTKFLEKRKEKNKSPRDESSKE